MNLTAPLPSCLHRGLLGGRVHAELANSPVYPEEKVHSITRPRPHGTNPELARNHPRRANIETRTAYPVECRNSFSVTAHHEGTASSPTKERPYTPESQLALDAQLRKQVTRTHVELRIVGKETDAGLDHEPAFGLPGGTNAGGKPCAGSRQIVR